MRKQLLAVLLPLVLGGIPSLATAQDSGSPSIASMAQLERAKFVSTASHLVGTYQPSPAKATPQAMAMAAKEFLQSLDEQQRKAANLALADAERREWTNLPAPVDAGGVRMGDLNATQLKKACDLMAVLFSDHGYRKMRDIMLADDQLLRNGQPRAGFGTENFSIVVFGEPSPDQAWAFQLDGHHVGVNLALEGDSITMSPSFIGTQPHQYSLGDIKIHPFKQETGLAYQFLNSLADEQIKLAVLTPRRGRIVTGPGNDGKVPKPVGLTCDQLDENQKATLLKLIRQWVNDLPEKHAKARMQEIEAELGQMKFSWNGNKAPGSDISYRIQSPSLIIEYACQNLGGNPIDHLHSVYRNPKNEYGKQL